jgi:hypothetical protein
MLRHPEDSMQHGARASLLVLAGLVAWGSSGAAGPSLRPLHQKMNGMRAQITNLSARFANGVVGGISADADAAAATPGGDCCSSNLERIDQQLEAVSALLSDLDRTYAEAGNRDGLTHARELRTLLANVDKAADLFAGAPTKEQAELAVGNLHRTYIQARKAHEALLACCALPGDTAPADPAASAPTNGAVSPSAARGKGRGKKG